MAGGTLGAISPSDAVLAGTLALVVTALMHTAEGITVAGHTRAPRL